MKRDSVMTIAEHEGATTTGARAKRLAGPNRRAQVLRTASTQFAMTGFHGTTTLALAKAAGISEPVLYVHFGSKDCLFREAVEANVQTRLRALDSRLSSIARQSEADCIAGMAEETILACLSDAGNAVLTNWALLEAPEYAAGLHRNEIGSAGTLWDRELARRFPASRSRVFLSMDVVPYAVNACLAYGFWLATLRHTAETAGPLARHFALGIAQAASTILNSHR